jgi:hypothetical protein
MSLQQIGGVIYDSCPLLFKLLKEETEKNRLTVSFTPNWYHKKLGIDFSKKWHTDPFYRQQSYIQMKKYMLDTFPEYDPLDIGDEHTYNNCPATIGAAFSIAFIPAIFGKSIEYCHNNWPSATGGYLTDKEVESLDIPNLDKNSFFHDFLIQLKKIHEVEGGIKGQLNYQGVLNNAIKLRGEQVFIDMLTRPSLSNHLFEVITKTMVNVVKKIYQLQKESGIETDDHFVTSNCTVNMISSQTYQEHLLKFDKMLADSFRHFGIHNCAWKVDPYLDAYAKIPNVAYLDFGLDSDFKKIKKLFPLTRRSLIYDPERLNIKSNSFVEDFERIKNDLFPCDVILASLDTHISIERIHEFIKINQRLFE